jgi:preprotein translocase subunit SecD
MRLKGFEMDKKNIAIAKISIISVIVALLLIFSFISFSGFAGFFNATQKGTELDKGIYANYNVIKGNDVTDEEFAEDFNNTFLKIRSLIEQKNYQDSVVYKGSNNTIRIETPKVGDASALLTEIGAGLLKIRTSSDSSSEVKISGDDVTFAVATTSTTTGYWGTYIQFTEESAEVLADMTKNASSSSSTYLYFYRGDSDSYFFYLPVSSPITADYLFISSSSGSMSQQDAINLAITVSCGSMPAVVEIQGEVKTIEAIDGAMLGLEIALGVILLLLLVIFSVVYRELGLIVSLSLLFYAGVMVFLIQAIPVITITSASLGAVLIGLILVAAFNFVILERIKAEFAIGKKLNMAIKTGYKKSINIIADLSGALLVISLISFFICKGIIQSFMMTLLTGAVVACISALFITYQLITAYSVFNKNNGKKVNFAREENVNEIE